MPRVIVLHVDWHKTTRDERWGNEWEGMFLGVEKYKTVLDCDTAVLTTFDHVFRLTNTIDRLWTDHFVPDDLPNGPRQRSTSVGDLVYTGGQGWRKCDRAGWVELPDELLGELHGAFGL